ncbi:hypothetical protein [Chondromyces apiculatus]|nr:hypothetical protein [Chondromyces apiculatus]
MSTIPPPPSSSFGSRGTAREVHPTAAERRSTRSSQQTLKRPMDRELESLRVLSGTILLMRALSAEEMKKLPVLQMYVFKAKQNTIEKSLGRARKKLGIQPSRRDPEGLLRRASELGIGVDPEHIEAARRFIDAWISDAANETFERQLAHADNARLSSRRALRAMRRAWRELAEALDKARWHPIDIEDLKGRAEALGLQFAPIPRDLSELSWVRVMQKATSRSAPATLHAWAELLERYEAPAQARLLLKRVAQASERYRELPVLPDDHLDAITKGPPHSPELEERLEAFLSVLYAP